MIEFNTLQELFADPARWTQDVSLRDKYGNQCLTREQAVCCCLRGGMILVYGNKWQDVHAKISTYIREKFGFYTLTNWNDQEDRKIEEVQALVKELNV